MASHDETPSNAQRVNENPNPDVPTATETRLDAHPVHLADAEASREMDQAPRRGTKRPLLASLLEKACSKRTQTEALPTTRQAFRRDKNGRSWPVLGRSKTGLLDSFGDGRVKKNGMEWTANGLSLEEFLPTMTTIHNQLGPNKEDYVFDATVKTQPKIPDHQRALSVRHLIAKEHDFNPTKQRQRKYPPVEASHPKNDVSHKVNKNSGPRKSQPGQQPLGYKKDFNKSTWDQTSEVYPQNPDREMDKCGNCGLDGHELGDCALSEAWGGIKGCPPCNTKAHVVDDCKFLNRNKLTRDAQIKHWLLDKRNDKCQIFSKSHTYHGISMGQASARQISSLARQHSNRPWTRQFGQCVYVALKLGTKALPVILRIGIQGRLSQIVGAFKATNNHARLRFQDPAIEDENDFMAFDVEAEQRDIRIDIFNIMVSE